MKSRIIEESMKRKVIKETKTKVTETKEDILTKQNYYHENIGLLGRGLN